MKAGLLNADQITSQRWPPLNPCLIQDSGTLFVHQKRKNGWWGWRQRINCASYPLQFSSAGCCDSRLKQKLVSQGYLSNPSLEVPSVLKNDVIQPEDRYESRGTAFQTFPPRAHSLPTSFLRELSSGNRTLSPA